MKKLSIKVLLLNSTYEPLGTLSARKVLKKLAKNPPSFHIEKYYEGNFIVTAGGQKVKLPAVIRLTYYVHLKHKYKENDIAKRSSIYLRDGWRCAYCLKKLSSEEITLDHVVPRARGGKSNPENLVTSCKECNNKKGDKTPDEAKMTLNTSKSLLKSNINLIMLKLYADKIPEWQGYIYG